MSAPSIAVVDDFLSSAAGQAVGEYAPQLRAGYLEYLRRLEQGEAVDVPAFCADYGSLAESLAKLICVHDWTYEAEPEWPEVGKLWQGFYVLRELGRGSFARVYLARELAVGERLVAVKVSPLSEQQADLLGKLDHPQIVPIHWMRRVGEVSATIECMPYLGHATMLHLAKNWAPTPTPAAAFQDICRDERLPAEIALDFPRNGTRSDVVRWLAEKIASALVFMHEKNIVHRDLKPSNVLLEPDGNPRLLDFNLSARGPLGQERIGGTLPYMAPEHLLALERGDDQGVTAKADIFSLGTVLYECLVGKHPFAPDGVSRDVGTASPWLRERQRAGSPPPAANAKFDRSLLRIIQRCLAFDADARPSAVELQVELARQRRRLPRWGRAVRRHPLRTACAVAILAVAIGWTALVLSNQPTRGAAAYQRGVAALQAGDARQAWDEFTDALAHGGYEETCLAGRGRAALKLAEKDTAWLNPALADFQNAHKTHPQGQYLAGMGYCMQLNKLPLASVCYDDALAHGFENAQIHYNLGSFHRGHSAWQKAQKHLEQALALESEFKAAHLELAAVFLNQFESNQLRPKAVVGKKLPAQLVLAAEHLAKGLPERETAPAIQALEIARIYAALARYDADYAPHALDWFERAGADGLNLTRLSGDPAFQALQALPRFGALVQQFNQDRLVSKWARALNPLESS